MMKNVEIYQKNDEFSCKKPIYFLDNILYDTVSKNT